MRSYGPDVAAAVGYYRIDRTDGWAADYLRSRAWMAALADGQPSSLLRRQRVSLIDRDGATVGEGLGGTVREALLAALVDALDREVAARAARAPAIPPGAVSSCCAP